MEVIYKGGNMMTSKTNTMTIIGTHTQPDYSPEDIVDTLTDTLSQGSSHRGPPAALGRVLCGPGRVFYKIQCVMNIEA